MTILPLCPVCNLDHNDNLIDTIYPANRNGLFNVCCHEHNSGCGRIIYGINKEDSIKNWSNPSITNQSHLTIKEVEKLLLIKNNIKNF